MWLWRTIERSPAGSGMTDGEEVEGAVEPRIAEPEVGGADRRHEARVEGPGQPQRRGGPVPTETEGEVVGAKLAGVEEPQDLDPVKAGRQELPVLGQRVLAQVPGVIGLQ